MQWDAIHVARKRLELDQCRPKRLGCGTSSWDRNVPIAIQEVERCEAGREFASLAENPRLPELSAEIARPDVRSKCEVG